MSPQSSPARPSDPDRPLRILRESIAAGIALLIVVTTSVMLYIIFTRYVSSIDPAADKQFERAKDLLLFINPLLGVVIGYYFNKVSTEARAEKAEANVQASNTNAQQAIADRQEAVEKASEAKAALDEVIPAAQKLLNETETKSSATLGIGDQAAPDTSAQFELRAALERAQRIAR